MTIKLLVDENGTVTLGSKTVLLIDVSGEDVVLELVDSGAGQEVAEGGGGGKGV